MRLLTLVFLAGLGCAGGAPEEPKSGEADPADDSATPDSRVPPAEDADRDGVPASQDCDDQDPDVGGASIEVCDGLDNDCDGLVDGEDPDVQGEPSYTDADGDGYGQDGTGALCQDGEGRSAAAGDCDDDDPATHPGADEPDCADPHDYNCDGSVGYADQDGDGYAACLDCDDEDAGAHPGGDERCDGQDNDCDGLTDDADPDVSDASTWYTDGDADGYGGDDAVTACEQPAGTASSATDCDDADPATHPDAAEPDCTDPHDYNCDGVVVYADADGDGWAACEDCDDRDRDVSPDGVEVCGGGDEDCDGLTDDADPDVSGTSSWYSDADGDGYGDPDSLDTGCATPTGAVKVAGDCDDADKDINPGEKDACDAADNDCSGYIDDGGDCPCDIEYYESGAYAFCDGWGVSWSYARSSCQAYNYDLASLNDSDEADWVLKTASGHGWGWYSDGWWIGYSDDATEGTWLWVDGSGSTYTDWASGQPSGHYAEDYAAILPNYFSPGWYDYPYYSTYFFVCEAG